MRFQIPSLRILFYSQPIYKYPFWALTLTLTLLSCNPKSTEISNNKALPKAELENPQSVQSADSQSEAVIIEENSSNDEGLQIYNQEGEVGYKDLNGNIVIPAQFIRASKFQDGMAVVQTGYEGSFENFRDGIFSLINEKGEVIKQLVPPENNACGLMKGQILTCNKDRVPLYTSHDKNTQIILEIPFDAEVHFIQKAESEFTEMDAFNSEWFNIQYLDVSGWVPGIYFTPSILSLSNPLVYDLFQTESESDRYSYEKKKVTLYENGSVEIREDSDWGYDAAMYYFHVSVEQLLIAQHARENKFEFVMQNYRGESITISKSDEENHENSIQVEIENNWITNISSSWRCCSPPAGGSEGLIKVGNCCVKQIYGEAG